MNKVEVDQSVADGGLSVGTFYQHTSGGLYILTLLRDEKYTLVSLTCGFRYCSDLNEPFDGCYSDFKKLPKGTKITITVGEER